MRFFLEKRQKIQDENVVKKQENQEQIKLKQQEQNKNLGTGTFFAPVDSGAFMRPVIDRGQAEALIDAMPGIAPAICNDNRFNHVDAFYKELFRKHTCEALVSIVKGLNSRMAERKTKSSRAEATMKRAKDMLHGELAVALDMDVAEVEPYILQRIGEYK